MSASAGASGGAASPRPGAPAPSGPAPWFADIAEGPAPAQCGWLDAGGGVTLRAAVWAAPDPAAARGHVLLFPGRTEYLEKYGRVVARLLTRGFAVAALDWRGQGLSTRAMPLLGHVGAFKEFQDDAAALTGWGPVASLSGPRLLLAHSMGGCIGLRAISDGALTGAQAPVAAVFSAPMWALAGGGAKSMVGRGLARVAEALGRGRNPVAGMSAERTYVLAAPFEGNVLTTDRTHWDWFVAQARAHPELTLAAPTWSWLAAASRETDALRHHAEPGVPRLLLLGTDEAVVSPEAIRAHAARFDRATLAEIGGGRHEGLMEDPDGPLGRALWETVDAFLAARLA